MKLTRMVRGENPERCMEHAGNRVVELKRRRWLHQLGVGVREDFLVGLRILKNLEDFDSGERRGWISR